MKKILFVFILFLTSCSSPSFTIYITADKATYDAVAAEYLVLVRSAKDANGNATYDKDQVARRERLIDSWRIRIEEAQNQNMADK